jgi:predicted P-loop ATPase
MEKDKISKFTQEMELLKAFLADHYRFRRNVITGGIEYACGGNTVGTLHDGPWLPLTKEVMNRITLDAIEANIEVWDKDLRRYVESTYVSDYDPVADYLSSLPRWDGRERIRRLAERVPTENREWPRYFHRWFLGMVAQWLSDRPLHGNTMVPLIVGRQGDGKSTFCRLLLPDELQPYYTDRLDFAKRTETERMLTRFVLINVDEFDSISRPQNAFLKHLLQKSDVMVRKLYETVVQQRKRYASFIATTNDPTPLTDPTGSRRFLCIQTCGVIDTKRPVNHAQLYAQAKTEIERGARTWFDRAEERRIQLSNTVFQQYDSVEAVFMEMFHHPSAGEPVERLSPYQMLARMRRRYPSLQVNLSAAQKLGRLLVRQKFRAVRKSACRVYDVAFSGVSE